MDMMYLCIQSGTPRQLWVKVRGKYHAIHIHTYTLTGHRFCGCSRYDSRNIVSDRLVYGLGNCNVEFTDTECTSIVLTYCHHYRPCHEAWKTRRLNDDTNGVSQGTQWWIDCYSVVSCTSPNIHTALVSPSTVVYSVPSHSGS